MSILTNLLPVFTVLLCSLSFFEATEVSMCNYASIHSRANQDYSFEELDKRVRIDRCKKEPCYFNDPIEYPMEIEFTPKHDIPDLKTYVTISNGIPLHVPYYWGKTACNKVWFKNGTQASCPLKQGIDYVYKTNFPTKYIGKDLMLELHWALTEEEAETDVLCFESKIKVHYWYFGEGAPKDKF